MFPVTQQLNLYALFKGNSDFKGVIIPATLGEEFVDQHHFNRRTD
jgi:hypothetical protein